VIVPILSKNEPEKVLSYCAEICDTLKKAGYRVHFDKRDLRPGNKFYAWELKGVPLRPEICARDIQNGVVTLARRDSGEKVPIKSDEMLDGISRNLLAIQENLYARANEALNSSIHQVSELSDVKPGINVMGWCGEEECGHRIEESTEMAVLGEPVGVPAPETKCIVCGKPTGKIIYCARTY
jgi:prolyl-tRNA synthetase